VKRYGRAAKADRTIAEYARDWRAFERHCRTRGLSALPADPPTVARYAATLAGVRAIATIRRRMTRYRRPTKRAPRPPTKLSVKVLADIVNQRQRAAKEERPHCRSVARGALLTIDEATLKGKRDRALLLLGFAGALRRGELPRSTSSTWRVRRAGALTITLPRSKTDQEGAGRDVAIPCVRPDGCARRGRSAAGLTPRRSARPRLSHLWPAARPPCCERQRAAHRRARHRAHSAALDSARISRHVHRKSQGENRTHSACVPGDDSTCVACWRDSTAGVLVLEIVASSRPRTLRFSVTPT
jgi:hypothetical protein